MPKATAAVQSFSHRQAQIKVASQIEEAMSKSKNFRQRGSTFSSSSRGTESRDSRSTSLSLSESGKTSCE
jgi:hypothetical protein